MRKLSPSLLLFFILIAATLLRVDFLLASHFVLDADEAIVGLMALRHTHGAPMPVFYYGQPYMGSLEPFLISITIDTLGISPSIALKLVPLSFSLLLIYYIYILGKEIGGTRTGLYAALLSSIAPATLLLWSAKARGGFIETVTLGALVLIWVVRWLREENPRPQILLLIGFLLGAGWWINNQILYFMLPTGFAVLTRVKSVRSFVIYLFSGLSAFFLGSFPFWFENLRTGFGTFKTLGKSSGGSFFMHLRGYLEEALPILFGAQRYWGGQGPFQGSTVFLWILLLSVLLVFVVVRWRKIAGLFAFRLSRDGGPELLFLFLVSVTFVFCLSSFGYLSKAPRYLLPIYAGYFPLVAYVIVQIQERYSKILGVIFCLAFLSLHLLSAYAGGRALPGEPFVYKGQRVAKDHTEIIRWLNDRQIQLVRTNYWIGYRLAFETGERIQFVMYQEPNQVRISEYEEKKRQTNPLEIPFVLVPEQAKIVRSGLDLAGYTYQVSQASGYTIIYDIIQPHYPTQRLTASEVELTASSQPELAVNALDRDLATRWASGRPQSSDMVFSVALKHPRKLAFLSYSLGQWTHDAPVELRIDVIDVDGKRIRVAGKRAIQALSYTFFHSPFYIALPDVEIAQVEFFQLGTHPIFDWSIAEIDLLYHPSS